jgi:hypothetical protein
VCGPSTPQLDPADMPVSSITWVDSRRFLFASGLEQGLRALRLGKMYAPGIRIGPFIGSSAYYEFNKENGALGVGN